jgi:phosphatidylinositol alpha 1,6-mannosyltransferase
LLRVLENCNLPVVVVDPTPFTPRVGAALASSAAGVRLLAMVGVTAQLWSPGVRSDEHHPGLRSVELHRAWSRSSSTVVGYAGPVGEPASKHVRRLTRVAGLEDVRLVVLGSGPGTATLRSAGARVVGTCGGLELARALASLDVFVQARKNEAGFLTLRKALASGVPVVAFDTATVRDVVAHRHNGLLVPPDRGRTGISEAVALLAADPTLRARLAARARASVAGRTWADAVAELVAASAPRNVLSSRGAS